LEIWGTYTLLGKREFPEEFNENWDISWDLKTVKIHFVNCTEKQ